MKIAIFPLILFLIISCSRNESSTKSNASNIIDNLVSSAHAGPVWEVSGLLAQFPACGGSIAISEDSKSKVSVRFSFQSSASGYYDESDNYISGTAAGDFFTYGTVLQFTKVSPYLWRSTGLNGIDFEARYRKNSDNGGAVSYVVGNRSTSLGSDNGCF